MKRILLVLLSVLSLAIPTSAVALPGGGPDEPDWYVDEDALPFDGLEGVDASQYWGVEQGAGFRAEVPADWNGSLVMWAHGFRGAALELTVDNHPLRAWLLANGFAWAASSYRANDYNVGAGVTDTRRLVTRFTRDVARPDRVYLTGASMGGHVTARSIEQYPNVYDGAMPICGVLGDYELFDYFLDFNLAAQQLALGASRYPVTDATTWLGADVPAIKANLEAVPGGWPAVLNETGQQFKQLVELRSGGDRPNFDEAWFFWNSFPSYASTPGNFLFDLAIGDGTLAGEKGVVADNVGVDYHLDLDPATSTDEAVLNEQILRVEGAERLRNAMSLRPVPVVTGDIDVPVLSLHNLGDLFVPFHNEVVYAHEVAEAGKSHLLVQRAIRGVDHCGFTPTELVTAMADLVRWVEDGVRPAGDEVLDPAVVAADDYGCRFTDFATPGGHVLATPCG
jgi:hypothetical protein